MRTRRTRKRRKKNGKRAAILAAIALSLGALTVWATRRQPQADTASLSTETTALPTGQPAAFYAAGAKI